jgi:hypothetical protein
MSLALLVTTLMFATPSVVVGVIAKNMLDRFWMRLGWM